MASTAPRAEVVDGLRALAIAGVVVVNTASFALVGSGPIAGIVEPAGSVIAACVHGIIVALFQNKAYPLLAFLVGYTMAMQLRGGAAHAIARRKRVAWIMIALGLAHGFLLYFGDILLAYGLMMLILVRLRKTRLRRVLRAAVVIGVISILMSTSFMTTKAQDVTHALGDAATWGEAIAANAEMFAYSIAALPIGLLPAVLTFGLLGLAAGRLRWLEAPQHWAAQWRRVAHVGLVAGLLLNLANGVFSGVTGYRGTHYDFSEFTLPNAVGPLLTAGIVAAVALRFAAGNAQWLRALAPAGRYTLSMYLGTSAVLMLTVPQAGLGLSQRLGTAGLFVFALTLCAVWIVIALTLAKRGIAGPAERLLRR
ncbi:MAG: DUF418 domain-containing protein [Burkholderiaceae bacterium]